MAGSRSSRLNASAVRIRASAAGSPLGQRPRLGDQRLHLPGRGRGRDQARAAIDQLGVPGEVAGRAGPVTGAQRGIGRGPAQPQRLVAELSRLRSARRVAQRRGGGRVVGGELGGLLVPPLRLAGQAAGEAQLGQPDRQPVRLRAVLGSSAAQPSAPRNSSATWSNARPPGTGGLASDASSRAALGRQAPAQVPDERLDRLARVVEPIGAVLADRLQRAVAGPARLGDRDQQALVGQPGQDGRDGAGRHRRPARSTPPPRPRR